MQSWTWRTIIFGAAISVLIYTAFRPDPESSLVHSATPVELVDYLTSSRDSLRRQAAARLLAHGQDAVPALEGRVPAADELELEQIFLVFEDLYVSADAQIADATEAALERLAVNSRKDVRQMTEELFQANHSRRYLRACAKVEALGGKLLASPFKLKANDMQIATDMVVIDADWTGGDAGLKNLLRMKGLAWVHVATDAPVSREAVAELASLSGASIRHEHEASCLGVEVTPRRGVLVIRRLVAGAPAERAGLESMDRLISIAGVKVSSFDEFTSQLKSQRPGETVEIVVLRSEQEMEIPLELGTDFGTGRCRCLDAPATVEPEPASPTGAVQSIPGFIASPVLMNNEPPSTDRLNQLPAMGFRPPGQVESRAPTAARP